MGPWKTGSVVAMRKKRRNGWLQRCQLSYDQARCMHPPSIKYYVIQAFSITSDFDPKLMLKEQNQITMRKVCIVMQNFLLCRPNHHYHLETVVKRCSRRNQWWASRAALVRCGPSIFRHDPRKDELALSSKRRAQRGQSAMSARHAL